MIGASRSVGGALDIVRNVRLLLAAPKYRIFPRFGKVLIAREPFAPMFFLRSYAARTAMTKPPGLGRYYDAISKLSPVSKSGTD
jgi:hypothetical protein